MKPEEPIWPKEKIVAVVKGRPSRDARKPMVMAFKVLYLLSERAADTGCDKSPDPLPKGQWPETVSAHPIALRHAAGVLAEVMMEYIRATYDYTEGDGDAPGDALLERGQQLEELLCQFDDAIEEVVGALEEDDELEDFLETLEQITSDIGTALIP